MRRARPGDCHAGEQRDERAPPETRGARSTAVMRGLDPRIHLLAKKDGLHRNSGLLELRIFTRRTSGKPDLRCQARQ
jgi:hypothetical protein